MAVTPYTGAFGPQELRHLLRRSLFGVSPADMAHFNGMPLNAVVNELLNFTDDTTPPIKAYSDLSGGTPDPNAIDAPVAFGDTWTTVPIDYNTLTDDSIGYRVNSFQYWWAGLMVHQERNLREKLVLFYHSYLVTQGYVVFDANSQYALNRQFRQQALGNFRQLVYDVTLEPHMLVYLNGYLNVASAPDENYGRELMELFTLGEGSGYTEADVHAAARVLTGWSVAYENNGQPALPHAVYYQGNHDATDKQFSSFFGNALIAGHAGPNGGATEINELLDLIFAKEECALFVCRKLYHFFVHGEIDADTEANFITELAALFQANTGAPNQMRTVLHALFTSDHFFSSTIRGCMVKSPADHAVGIARSLGMPFPGPDEFEAQYSLWGDVFWQIAYAGQQLTDPPNVAGWLPYRVAPAYDLLWLDNATYPARRDIYNYFCYSGLTTPPDMVQAQSANVNYPIDFVALVQQLTDPYDPNILINDLAELLFAVPVSQAVKDQLKHNFLLQGQQSDYYWSSAYETYVTDPNTTDMTAQMVPSILVWLITDMQGAAENNLF
ncbi:MAG: DUF1800 domain-containing protein [Flavobacteriales bacterium]|jgi:hypothetical protein|nr:DUF1800 family protein [Flavobacteriales bacterium]MCI1752695.1 DUF1800 domain-containing protein [Flavobacteriales bacterium]